MIGENHLGALADALAKAQAEMANAAFNKKNPHFKSSYADLSAIRDAVTPSLAKHGLAVTQTLSFRDGAPFLVTRLMHSGGGEVEGVYPLPANHGDPQKFGSALTYARRYSLAAICNIASEEDDDGNAAAPMSRPRPAAAPISPAVANVEADAPKSSATEELVAWAETVARGLTRFGSVAKLDDWEAKPETDTKMDALMAADRDTWQALKKKIAERRTALAELHPAMA